MENSEPTIENKLKDLRKEHKLSQEELADELGISRQSIIALEQGKYLPSLPLVVNLCKFFHSPFEDIFIFEIEIEDEIVNLAESDHYLEDSIIAPKTAGVMPKIDIKDKKDSIEVRAELPVMVEEDIDIEIDDGVMTISGEKKADAAFATGEAGAPAPQKGPLGGASAEGGMRGKEDCYYYKESHTGSFSRSFTLPADVKEEKAEAEMKHGVLTVTIPKLEPKKTTKVKIALKKK